MTVILLVIVSQHSPASPKACGEDPVAQALAARSVAAGFQPQEQEALRQCSVVESESEVRGVKLPLGLVEASSDKTKAQFTACLQQRGIGLETQQRLLGLLEEVRRDEAERRKAYVACSVERRRGQSKTAGPATKPFPAVDLHGPNALGYGGLAKPGASRDAGVRVP